MHHSQSSHRQAITTILLAAAAVLFLLILAPTEAAPVAEEAATAEWSTIAGGLANPRGLIFGPDGALYVAEAGSGGAGACIPDPEGGERCLGDTGAITQVMFDADMNPTGQTQVITGVPSLAHETTGAATGGPTAVAFSGNEMYFTTGFGGDPADLEASGPLGADGADFGRIMTAGPGDSYTSWVDLGAFEATENPDGDLPDTNPFDLLALPSGVARAPDADAFLAVDAGANTLLGVSEVGAVTTLAVFPETMVEFPPGSGAMVPMDAVPTSVVVGPDGAYYLSQLTGFPFPYGGASVWRVEAGGDPAPYAEGFTNILDLAFAADGSLYVLEMFTNSILSGDPTGAITRIAPDGSRAVVAREGLITPTDMVIGPDHALYVTNFSTSPTDGVVVRIPTRLSEAANFSAFLDGAQENPPVDTDATGVARFALAADGTLSWEVAVRNIENVTASHIHIGAVGSNGGIVIPLFTGGPPPFDEDNPVSGSEMLTDEQIEELLAGNYYVNVHTSANPGGEIRGQIWPAETTAWRANLSGANEVPPVDTDANGVAYMTLNATMDTLYYRVKLHDAANVTASHIHEGAEGTNGPVIVPLYTGGPPPFDEDNPVSGSTPLDITQLAALAAHEYYVNVHTTMNPAGETRGQLERDWPQLGYHALLTGAEENPPVDTHAVGVATYKLSADLSMVDYHLAVDHIEDVTAAHLHTGWAGQNGGVAHPLFLGGPPPLEPGAPVNGLLPFDAQHVLDLWSGYYYTNVHTMANPGGEIRGQTEGATVFAAELTGANEVPPNGSAGTGRAVMALSDDGSTLYWRVMVSNLEHITAAHIHQAPAGENGPVIIPLFLGGPPPFDVDNPVSGSTPVSDAQIMALVEGDYYVNVHTSHLPGGEIRGQLWRWEPNERYGAWLDGAQENPPVDTEATGQGRFLLDRLNNLHYFVTVADIENVTASHIHKGRVGENGPVIFPLYTGGPPPFDADNPVGCVAVLNAENLVDLLTGYYYVNVHTTENPSGEIRGQIAPRILNYMAVVASR